MSPPNVLCFSEDPALGAGLVGAARVVLGDATTISAVLPPGEPASTGPYAAAGASRVYRIVSPHFAPGSPENVATALASAIKAAQPDLVLLASTKRGREYAARLAGLVDGAVETGIGKFSLDAAGVRLTREMLSGNAVGEELVAGRLPILALAPGSLPPAPADGPASEIIDLPVDLSPPGVRILETRVKPAGALRIEGAERIVAVGRGLRKKEDLALIEQLAKGLGAVVGCTRPVAAEAGWLSDDHWIGLTGHRVKPKLYVAVGISGAVQHLVGMRESGVVVAINKDANAPIFQHADYRLVGDLYTIVPALVQALGGA